MARILWACAALGLWWPLAAPAFAPHRWERSAAARLDREGAGCFFVLSLLAVGVAAAPKRRAPAALWRAAAVVVAFPLALLVAADWLVVLYVRVALANIGASQGWGFGADAWEPQPWHPFALVSAWCGPIALAATSTRSPRRGIAAGAIAAGIASAGVWMAPAWAGLFPAPALRHLPPDWFAPFLRVGCGFVLLAVGLAWRDACAEDDTRPPGIRRIALGARLLVWCWLLAGPLALLAATTEAVRQSGFNTATDPFVQLALYPWELRQSLEVPEGLLPLDGWWPPNLYCVVWFFAFAMLARWFVRRQLALPMPVPVADGRIFRWRVASWLALLLLSMPAMLAFLAIALPAYGIRP